MKITIALLIVSLATAGYSQVWSLPPSSTLDGVTVSPIGLNAGVSHWENPFSLGAYAVAGDGDSDRVAPGVADQHLGLTWQQSIPSAVLAAKNALNTRGGSMRAIFVGETAGGRNNFGYSRSGVPTGPGSFTLFADMQAAGNAPTIRFGQHADISFAVGGASAFDFWFNAVDATRGGVYSLFQSGSGGGFSSAQFLWSQDAIETQTWLPSFNAYAAVSTYLVSVDDLRLDAGSDRDYSDFRLALQFYEMSGVAMAAIPEPAHIAGMGGLVALLAAFCCRRKSGGRWNSLRV